MSPKIQGFGQILHLPDFKYVRPDEMVGNKAHGTIPEWNMVLNILQRFPFQPEMHVYPPALIKDLRLEKMKVDRSRMLMTDAAFWKMQLEHARASNIKKREAVRYQSDIDATKEHAERALAANAMWQAFYFRRALEFVMHRHQRIAHAREIEQAMWDFIREKRRLHGDHEAHDTRKMIKDGFARHEKFMAWRADNLFGLTSSKGWVRLKRHGQLMEQVMGEILWYLRNQVTHQHHKWRIDSLFVATPNGGIVQIHEGTGRDLAHVVAENYWPKVEKRTEKFEKWHDSGTFVVTANHGLIHMDKQGQDPPVALAALEEPRKRERRRLDREWHLSGTLVAMANGGFRPAGRMGVVGQPKEEVEAHVEAPKKAKATAAMWDWRLRHLFKITANHGIAPLKGHGHSLESVEAKSSDTVQERRHKTVDEWRRSHLYKATSNHSFMPLKNIGHSLESVMAVASDAPHKRAKVATDNWRQEHHFVPTANYGLKPIKFGGASLEEVTAKHVERLKDKITKRFYQHFLSDLYVVTANGGWARLAGHGQTSGRIRAQVAKPSEGLGAQMPIAASHGHELPSARLPLDAKEMRAYQHHLRSFKRSLAAHTETVSRLHDHIVRQSSVDATTSPDIQPLTSPTKPNKT